MKTIELAGAVAVETKNAPCNGCAKQAECATGKMCGDFVVFFKTGKKIEAQREAYKSLYNRTFDRAKIRPSIKLLVCEVAEKYKGKSEGELIEIANAMLEFLRTSGKSDACEQTRENQYRELVRLVGLSVSVVEAA